MLCMAVMYKAMLETYKVNPLKLYADTIGALDAKAQLQHDKDQIDIRDEEARKREAREKAARARLPETPSATGHAERQVAQAEAKERARLAAIRRAQELRERAAKLAREIRLRKPGPLIREQAQRPYRTP